jgi:hypothetical protein
VNTGPGNNPNADRDGSIRKSTSKKSVGWGAHLVIDLHRLVDRESDIGWPSHGHVLLQHRGTE